MKKIIAAIAFLLTITVAFGQDLPIRTGQSSHTIRIGGNYLRDDYLSPLKYGGVTFGYGFEAFKNLSKESHKLILRTEANLNFDYDDNPARNAEFWSLGVDFAINAMWKIKTDKFPIKLYAGPGLRANLGGLYSTRNGNNPASLKLSFDLQGTAMAAYRIPWEKIPALISLSWTTTLMGSSFSTQYGETYYELFMIKNGNGVANGMYFTLPDKSWYNELSLFVDIPIKNFMTLRTGYRLSNLNTNLQHLHTSRLAQSLEIGFVRQLRGFSGKETLDKAKVDAIF